MKMKSTCSLALLATTGKTLKGLGCIIALGAFALQAPAAEPPTHENFRAVEQSISVIRMEVKDSQDQNIGRVDDLAIDLENGRLVEVIVSSGGFLGLGERTVAVPPAALRFDPADGVLRINVDKKKFKAYPIGYFHIDIAEVRTAEGKLYLYVAVDRTSKFAFVQLVKKTGRTSASVFLTALVKAVPYKIHTVLTDNGVQFTFPPRYADGPTARCMTHMFDMRCRENGIEHRLTKIKHPWTNGQVERMNRTIKEAHRQTPSQGGILAETAAIG